MNLLGFLTRPKEDVFPQTATRDAEKKNADAPVGGRQGNQHMLSIEKTVEKVKTETSALFSEAHVSEARRAKAWLEDRLAKSNKLPPEEFIDETVLITPTMAGVMLERNRGNRSLKLRRFAYAKAMAEGRWKVHSQGISFSRDGLLNNGQNRLTAITIAGVPVKMKVTFGEDRDVFDILDTGSTRSGGDTLHVAGYKNTNNLSAAARLFLIVTGDSPGKNLSFTNDIIRRTVEENPRLEDVTTPGKRVARKTKCSAAAASTAIYLISEFSAHARRLDFFVDRLCDGAGLRSRDPILLLRDGLKDKEFESNFSAGASTRECAAFILAWNRWVRGKSATISALRWSNDQPFPMPE